MANITKVPNGPLVKKKGQFKGSTLQSGGKVKKAQNGIVTATPEQRAQALANRAEIKRKKDSILDRNASVRGMSREQVRAQQESDKNKPDVPRTNTSAPRSDKVSGCAVGLNKPILRKGGKVNKSKSKK